jgi:phospholipase A1
MLHKTTTVLIFTFIISIGYQCFSQEDHDHNWYFNNSKSLSELWELDDEHQRGTFILTSYKPIYITAAKYSTNPNEFPQAENSDKVLDEPNSLNAVE